MLQNRDLTTLVPVTMFSAHTTYITRVLLSPDVKHLATCSADHTVKIWHLDPKATCADPMAINNPNGPQLPSISSSTTSLSGSGIASPPPYAHTDSITTNGVDTDKAAPGLSTIAKGGLPLETTLANHQRWVWDCAFSADSAYLVTVCSDHYARLWELSTSSIIRQYNGHHRGAVCVALNDYSEPR
jgi:target of rapamycin complex subunit LST8